MDQEKKTTQIDKIKIRLDATTHLGDFCFTVSSRISNQREFEASLFYKASSRTASDVTQRNPIEGKIKNQPTNKTVVISKCCSNSMWKLGAWASLSERWHIITTKQTGTVQ